MAVVSMKTVAPSERHDRTSEIEGHIQPVFDEELLQVLDVDVERLRCVAHCRQPALEHGVQPWYTYTSAS